MNKFKIRGLKVTNNDKNLCIKDSYKIKNIDKMKIILNEALNKTCGYFTKRSEQSMINEWIAHNILYKLHICRKKSKDCDFEININKFYSVAYFILSIPANIKYKMSKWFTGLVKIKRTNQYKRYIKEHLHNIKKAYKELSDNAVVYQLVGDDILQALKHRVAIHDASKYSEEEFEPYRKNFYPVNPKEKEENKEAFEKAWEHHWKTNSHHWQHRKDKKTFDINNREEVLDVLENVLDWMAMGYKFHDRPYQYYENNKNHIKLNEQERRFLEQIIYEGIDAREIEKNGRK